MKSKTIKILAVSAVLASAAMCTAPLTACSDKEADNGTMPVSSWVGSSTKSGSMGYMSYGHLVNFYNDGTVTVYWGMYAGATGHYFGSYSGTYENGVVTYDYTSLTGSVSSQATFSVDLTAAYFQAKIFCGATTPSENFNYVQIAPFEPSDDADYIYIGSYVSGNSVNAVCVEVFENSFTANVCYNGVKGTFSGESRVDYSPVTDLQTPDYLCLSYNALTEAGGKISASGSKVETKIEFNTTTYLPLAFQSQGDSEYQKIICASIRSEDGSENYD